MKTNIETANRKEGELLRLGLTDPTARALVKVTAVLNRLPSDRARRRVLLHVSDMLNELEESKQDVGDPKGDPV